MGAFAVVTMPLDLSRRGAAANVALDLVATFPGTREVSLQGDAVVFELQFPGNLSGLVARLRSSLIPVTGPASVSVPVVSLSGAGLGDPLATAQRIEEGPEVWDAQFDRAPYVSNVRVNGERVEATIEPSTAAMHELYDALLTLALGADDALRPAAGV